MERNTTYRPPKPRRGATYDEILEYEARERRSKGCTAGQLRRYENMTDSERKAFGDKKLAASLTEDAQDRQSRNYQLATGNPAFRFKQARATKDYHLRKRAQVMLRIEAKYGHAAMIDYLGSTLGVDLNNLLQPREEPPWKA